MSTTEFRKDPAHGAAQQPIFVTTHWSVVLSAGEQTSPASAEALEKLCQAYWYPLYAHARRLGNSPADAEDLTQEFFSRLIQKNYLSAVVPERGRFRTFLLVAFKRFISEQWRRGQAQKRGGGGKTIPFDTAVAERFYQAEAPAAASSDEKQYEQRWALALLEKTTARLRDEFESAGKAETFDRLKIFLTADKAEVADSAMSDGALRIAVHRLRKRFRQILREEIAHTVSRAEDVDEELNYLLSVLSG